MAFAQIRLRPRSASPTSIDRAWSTTATEITPLEKFDFEARVLHTEHYSMDREAQLAPVDLAPGWGPMANQAVLDKVTITQSNRFYYWHVDEWPIPRRDIEVNSANMHMVPANADVERVLKSIRSGQRVTFSGYLIEARAPDGWRWKLRSRAKTPARGANWCGWESIAAN